MVVAVWMHHMQTLGYLQPGSRHVQSQILPVAVLAVEEINPLATQFWQEAVYFHIPCSSPWQSLGVTEHRGWLSAGRAVLCHACTLEIGCIFTSWKVIACIFQYMLSHLAFQ